MIPRAFTAFACNDSTKDELCKQKCSTCYPRSFCSVKIWKTVEHNAVDKKFFGKDLGPPVLFRPARRWENNGNVQPWQVLKDSQVKYNFECQFCFHDFEVKLSECTNKNKWCPFCSGKKCYNDNCEICFDLSASSLPDINRFAEEENEKHGIESDPRMIMKKSRNYYYFYCTGGCGHTYKRQLVTNEIHQCKYCTGEMLCENSGDPARNPHNRDICGFCFRNSLGFYKTEEEIPTYLNINEYDLDPCQIPKSSTVKIGFLCIEPACRGSQHYFTARVVDVCLGGVWCPFCSNPKRELCGECDNCFNDSFASAGEYHFSIDQDSLPSFTDGKTIFKNSREKLPFICEEKGCGRKFKLSPYDICYNNKWHHCTSKKK